MSSTAARYGPGLMGLFKRGWEEIPGVMGSAVMGFIGLGFGIAATIQYHKEGAYVAKYKQTYIVYRPDDPRVNVPTRDI